MGTVEKALASIGLLIAAALIIRNAASFNNTLNALGNAAIQNITVLQARQ